MSAPARLWRAAALVAKRSVRAAWPACHFLLLLACAPVAQAHTRSESYLVADIAAGAVRLTFSVPEAEAARLGTQTAASEAELAAYFTRHIQVTGDGRDCPPLSPARALPATKHYRRVELALQCPAGTSIVLQSSAFFEQAPAHVMFARISIRSGKQTTFTEQLISSGRRAVELDAGLGAGPGDGRLHSAGLMDYIALGIEHILTGPDHIAFVLGFVLIARRVRDLLLVVSGFTLGHSITLGLAVTGLLTPSPEYIDVLIALTIALIGVDNFVAVTRRGTLIAAGVGGALLLMILLKVAGYGLLPLPLLAGAALFTFCYLNLSARIDDGAVLRLVMTLIFGLIHGFAFAKDLIELQLPKGRMAELLFGFNLGVEIGQLTVIALLTLGAVLLARLRLAPGRRLVVETGSSALVALGTFWFVSRAFG